MKFQGLIKTIGGTVSRNSPTILTSLGVAGVVATTVMGGRDTIKAIRILDELDPDNEFTNKEKIKETYKCYIPTMIMGAVTIGCIIGANSINAQWTSFIT
jgi:predicted DNA repair protein MutK